MDYFGLSLNLANKILGLIPNFEQKEREKFMNLKKLYDIESKRSENDQDHDLIDWLRDELKPYLTRAVEFKQV